MVDPVLQVINLKTYFYTKDGILKAVDGISLEIYPGETLCVVGESGCGKSLTALSIMRLIETPPGKIVEGKILFNKKDLLTLSEIEMRKIRGNDISMIFQEPMTSLNPVHTIGDQIAEPIIIHRKIGKKEAYKQAIEMLKKVGIPFPEQRVKEYPYQLSGGMRQRVMIAIALSCDPQLLIADEPSTALDVTIQAQILELLTDLKRRYHMSMMMITHDLGVTAEISDKVAVMYAGSIVEYASVKSLYRNPHHPYTFGLMQSIPRIDSDISRLNAIAGVVPNPLDFPSGCKYRTRCPLADEICSAEEPVLKEIEYGHFIRCWRFESGRTLASLPKKDSQISICETSVMDMNIRKKQTNNLLQINNLKTYYQLKKPLFHRRSRYVKAVDDVSLSVKVGETLGLVGESGCGKSTAGKTILRLVEPQSGEIFYNEQNILKLSKSKMRSIRKKIQIIFQDPYASLNPKMSVDAIIGEAVSYHKIVNTRKEKREKIFEILRNVGMGFEHLHRYPHEFSGGQRQRIGIARALAVNPELIIADEPVSALDVSIQAQVINLMKDLQQSHGLTYVFIAHDLSVIKHMSDRIAVMYLGKIVELAPKNALFKKPMHPYSQALLSAIPIADPDVIRDRIILQGDVPSPVDPPSGCRFHPRCFEKLKICSEYEPQPVGEVDHFVCCHLYT